MDTETSGWHYVVKQFDPEEVKPALQDLVEDEDDPLTIINIEDDYDCEVKGIIVSKDGNPEVISCEQPVHIDYKQKQIQLPQEALNVYVDLGWSSEPIAANRIRYVGLPRAGNDLPRNFGDIAVLSVWNDSRDIFNVYLLSDNPKSAMLLVNALSRLVYETFEENAVRTHKFYRLNEGPIDVAFCSNDERARRDKLKQKKETDKILRGEDPSSKDEEQADDEDLPEPIKTPMYFTIDEEAIQLFEAPFAFHALHDFRFFREENEKSIDTIYVCNVEAQLEVQKGENVFFLYPQQGQERSETAYKELVELLRVGNIRPKSQTVFKGGNDFEKFYNSPPESDSKEAEEEVSSSEDELGDIDDRAPLQSSSRNTDQRFPPSTRGAAGSQSAGSGGSGATWLNNLISGSHLLVNVSEEMQMNWFAAESEIENLIKENKVPSSDVSSSGLDPQSSEHLQTVVENIRDKLLTNEYAGAVSQWRGCSKVYAKTLLSGASGIGDVEMLKRIYFLTG